MRYLKSYNIFELKRSLQINSFEELMQVLKDYNIPLHMYGTGGYKTPQHLWNEIKEDECVLSIVDNKIQRNVNFVGASIIYKKDGANYRLWEDRAVFKDGRIRVRQIPHSMAEKFKHGENPINSLIRGMKEELGIELNKNQFVYYNTEKIENNEDFPGIHSFHTGYIYFVVLNDKQFNPKGYVEEQKDKTIYFVWRKMVKRIAGHYPLPLGSDVHKFERFKILY